MRSSTAPTDLRRAADQHLSSSLGPFTSTHVSILRWYLVITTGLYIVGVAMTVKPMTDSIPLANPTGGFIAIALGLAALGWLAYRPDRATPAALAACAATPIVMAFHVLVNAELLCLIAVVFLSMYIRVSYPRRQAWVLVGALTIASVAALAIAPAPCAWILLLVVAVVIPAAAETFGRMIRALVVAACTDPLTGALNRAGWELATTALLARLASKRSCTDSITVIAIDVDDFKSLNDTHGHAAGDRFLVELVQAAHGVLPRRAIFARVGGDEFTVCIAERDASKAAELLMTLGTFPRITFGSATAPPTTANVADLHARADAELATRKRKRRR